MATSLRVAVSSGAAAVGWLVLGATGAQASEETLLLPVQDAATGVGRTVAETASPQIDEVPSAPAPVSGEPLSSGTATSPSGPVVASGSTVDVASPVPLPAVDEAVAGAWAVAGPGTDQLFTVVERTVSAPVAEVLPAGTLPQLTDGSALIVQDTVQDVVAPVVEQVVAPVVAPVVEQVTTAVEQTAPEVPGVEPALPAAPRIDVQLPADTVVAPVPVDVVVEVPVMEDAEAPEPARQTPVPAGTDPGQPAPAATQVPGIHDGTAADTEVPTATSSASTPPRADRPSPAETLMNHAPFPAGETAGPSSPWSGSSVPSGGAMLPGPGSTTSTGSGSGGSGTPARGSGPDSWPEMPGSLHFLPIFPQLTAADDDVFFGDIEQPPGPPAFDPGSTPD